MDNLMISIRTAVNNELVYINPNYIYSVQRTPIVGELYNKNGESVKTIYIIVETANKTYHIDINDFDSIEQIDNLVKKSHVI